MEVFHDSFIIMHDAVVIDNQNTAAPGVLLQHESMMWCRGPTIRNCPVGIKAYHGSTVSRTNALGFVNVTTGFELDECSCAGASPVQ
jgi:hypothetical protein